MQPPEVCSSSLPAPDYSAFISKCITAKDLKLGRLVHSHLIKTAFVASTFLANSLIDMYSKCNSILCSHKVFDDLQLKNTRSWNTIISACCHVGWFCKAQQLLDEMPERNVISYNSIISGFVRHGFYGRSIYMARDMQREFHWDGLWLDAYTVVNLINASASLGALKLLYQVHGLATVTGCMTNVVVCNTLVSSYGKCKEPFLSNKVFERMPERDVVSWTSMVVVYVQACQLDDAWQLFSLMPVKNVVSWTALISGFVQIGKGEKALYLFMEMCNEGIVPNATTYASVISACADIPLIERGKQLHGHIVRGRSVYVADSAYVINSLIDMYCKFGDMDSAILLFERFKDKDVVTWNTIITGFAYNGQAELSLSFYMAMLDESMRPNNVTFLGVLSACSHKGLILEGFQILKQMKQVFGVDPQLDHYSIIIDMLGRQNKLTEALKLIKTVPGTCDHVGMWGALLSACQVHGNTEVARRVAQVLLDLEPENAGRYVVISNIYSRANWRDDANEVRSLMVGQGLKKEVAYSCIEIGNTSHKFGSFDNYHDQIEDVKKLLLKLVDQLKDAGYVPAKRNLYCLENGEVI